MSLAQAAALCSVVPRFSRANETIAPKDAAAKTGKNIEIVFRHHIRPFSWSRSVPSGRTSPGRSSIGGYTNFLFFSSRQKPKHLDAKLAFLR
jgi:hypothetical protein